MNFFKALTVFIGVFIGIIIITVLGGTESICLPLSGGQDLRCDCSCPLKMLPTTDMAKMCNCPACRQK